MLWTRPCGRLLHRTGLRGPAVAWRPLVVAAPRPCPDRCSLYRTQATQTEAESALLQRAEKREGGQQRKRPRKPQPKGKANPDITEVFKLGKIALPLLLQYSIGTSSHLINTSFVGHLSDPVLLSSMVLATSLSMATGYTVMNGVASASETLCGQAHGAKNYKALQATFLRALCITALTCMPISLLWTHSESILVALGQPEAIAEGAARYLQLTIPALFLYSIHECVDKYLLSQKVVQPSLVITAATTALTPLFAWLFVVNQDLGLEGAAYAYVAVQACTTTLGLSYLAYRELIQLPAQPPEGWAPLQPDTSALTNWAPYLALAVPAVLSYCMEGWATEVLIFLSGMLDNAEVAVGVTGLALQLSTLVWLAAASIGSATSTRVANKLGRGDAEGAKLTAATATKSVIVSQALIGLGAYTFREPLLQLMTNNTDVINLALTVMPVLTCCFIADGLNVVQGGVLRGAGRQWWTAGLNIAGWWGVGVPLAYYLALVKDFGVPGLWAGFATASALQSALQYVAVNRGIDWDQEVQRAKEMMAGEVPPDSSEDDETDIVTENMDEDQPTTTTSSLQATQSPTPPAPTTATSASQSQSQYSQPDATTASHATTTAQSTRAQSHVPTARSSGSSNGSAHMATGVSDGGPQTGVASAGRQQALAWVRLREGVRGVTAPLRTAVSGLLKSAASLSR